MRRLISLVCSTVIAIAAVSVVAARLAAMFASETDSPQPEAVHSLRSVIAPVLPLAFEPAQQPNLAIRYLARARGFTVGFSRTALHVATGAANNGFTVGFANANPRVEVREESPLPGRVNYFVGPDPRQWRSDVPTFGRIRYRAIWPGIDALFYGTHRQLEYDLVVAPGADVRQAHFSVETPHGVRVTDDGQLTLRGDGGDVTWSRPVAYQTVGGQRSHVQAEYVVAGNNVSFAVGDYDRSLPLVIDPILLYSSYFGGSEWDEIFDVATDGSGAVFVTGLTNSPDFPIANGYQTSMHVNATQMAFVSKIAADGQALVYSTYVGGSATAFGHGIAVDGSGSAYVAGSTNGPDFPTTAGALQTTSHIHSPDQEDGVVFKLSPAGNRLVYSTYLGGSWNDRATDLAVDPTGVAVIVGWTQSHDFPTLNAVDPSNDGGHFVGFATRLNRTGTAAQYSTYLYNTAGAEAVALDLAGKAHIVGRTASSIPATANAAQPTFGGISDSYLIRLSPTGAWQYATYLGGPGVEDPFAVVADASGRTFLAGRTNGGGFPTTSDAYRGVAYTSDRNDAWFARIDASGRLEYSTYYGGTADDTAVGIDIDQFGSATIVGWTNGVVPVTADTYQSAPGGGGDAFVATFNASGRLAYATRLGGAGADQARGVAVHQAGRITVVGSTQSANYPTMTPLMARPACPASACQDGFITQFAARPPGSLPQGSIVIHPATDPTLRLAGNWRVVADPTAAGGARVENPNAGVPKVASPSAAPADYFEVSPTVQGGTGGTGTSYWVWIRGKAQNDDYNNDSVYMQFSSALTGNEAEDRLIWRIGTTEALTFVLEDCTGCGLSGWAWQDSTFGFKATRSQFIDTFDSGGPTTIRIHSREDGISIDQIILVPTDLEAPGFQKQDATIYQPREEGDGDPEIVLYPGAGPTPTLHGGWRITADATAAGGARVWHPDAGAPKINEPLASPVHYFETTFTPMAGVPYSFYVRGKADRNSPYNDSAYVQFSNNASWPIASTAALAVNLEECTNAGVSGWGWRSGTWCAGAAASTVVFEQAVLTTIRVQTREDGFSIDQIVLSSATYRGHAPGTAKNDTVIVPK